ncbi:GH116 family glycosyl-hydrolase [Microbacterium sp. NPDC089320]|uniref:GH116 family glycosyl-hydrolase n=1 Tax=Microbacterium sp. NPDC089320 TaxID=3155182 RepID=UPI00341E9370
MGVEPHPVAVMRAKRRMSVIAATLLSALVATTFTPTSAAQAEEPAGFEIPSAATVRPLGDIGPVASSALCQIFPQYCAFFPSATAGMGIPLGGIGAGNFMVNQSGTFGPWWFGGSQGDNHAYEVRALPQAAFHIYEKVGAGAPTLTTLASDGPESTDPAQSWESPLEGWNTLDTGEADYSALYPFGWMDYDTDKLASDVQMRFYSPIVAGEDKRSSLPVAYFDIQITNPSITETADVSTMFTMPNVAGHEGIEPATVREGLTSEYHEAKGIKAVTLSSDSDENTADAYKSEWTIAAKPAPGQTVSYVTSWDADGDGTDIYSAFADGTLGNDALDDSASAGAIAVSARLAPGETTTIPLVMTWDFPQVGFQDNSTVWMRRYTEFYGAKTNAQNEYVHGSYAFHQSFDIAKDALKNKDKNLKDVLKWWKPIADDNDYPDWLKEAALNQLANLPFHTSVWENGLVSDDNDLQALADRGLAEHIPADRAGNEVPGTHNYMGVDANSGGASTNGQGGEIGIYSQIVYTDLFPNIERDRMIAKAESIMDANSQGDPWDFSVTEREGDNPFIAWHQGYGAEPGRSSFIDRPSNNLYRMYDYAQRHDKDGKFLDFVYPAMVRTIGFLQDLVPDDYALPEAPGKNTFNTAQAGMASAYNDGAGTARFDSYTSSLYILALEAMIEAGRMQHESASVIAGWETALDAARADFEELFWLEESGYYQYRALVLNDNGTPQDPSDDTRGDSNIAHRATFLSQWLAERAGLDNVVDYSHYETHLQTTPSILPKMGVPMADYAYAAYQISAGKTLGNAALVDQGLAAGADIAGDLWGDPANAIEFNSPNTLGGAFGNLYPGWEGNLAVFQIMDALDTSVSKAGLRATLESTAGMLDADYTPATWRKLVRAQEDATDAMWSNANTQKKIDRIEEKLAAAIAGLKSTDTTAPTITVKPESKGKDGVFREVSFTLSDAGKIDRITLNGVEKDLSNATSTDLDGLVPGNLGATSGSNELKVYDVAGNVATLTFVLDVTAPTITVKTGGTETVGSAAAGYQVISFKLFDEYKVDRVTLNGVVKDLTDSQWSDLNAVKPGVFGAVLGVNEMVVHDVAGSTRALTFTLVDPASSVPAWEAAKAYDKPAQVSYNGAVYVAQWWTQNERPGATATGSWMEQGVLVPAAGTGVRAWTISWVYTGGETVAMNGHLWKAKWWTRNQTPGDPSGPWQDLGAY